MAKPSIFVSIASYRDPECQHTVRDLFEMADYPERVSVGICWQFEPKFDAACFDVAPPYPAQVRELAYHAKDSRGSCWARSQALSLCQDEDYTLQIDSHMRFVRGWDSKMIDTLRRCPSRKAVISVIAPGYRPPRQLQEAENAVSITYVCKLGTAEELQPVWLSGYFRKADQVRAPLLGAFIVGNFLFAPSSLFRAIPFDPHIYFRGQESVYSARLWTSGWDVYMPDQVLIYHYWDAPAPDGKGLPAYKMPTEEALVARQRVLHLLGIAAAKDRHALRDIDAYGMGKVRPLMDFWEFSGVDLRRGVIAEKASGCQWTPYVSPLHRALDHIPGIAMTPRFNYD